MESARASYLFNPVPMKESRSEMKGGARVPVVSLNIDIPAQVSIHSGDVEVQSSYAACIKVRRCVVSVRLDMKPFPCDYDN